MEQSLDTNSLQMEGNSVYSYYNLGHQRDVSTDSEKHQKKEACGSEQALNVLHVGMILQLWAGQL